MNAKEAAFTINAGAVHARIEAAGENDGGDAQGEAGRMRVQEIAEQKRGADGGGAERKQVRQRDHEDGAHRADAGRPQPILPRRRRAPSGTMAHASTIMSGYSQRPETTAAPRAR